MILVVDKDVQSVGRSGKAHVCSGQLCGAGVEKHSQKVSKADFARGYLQYQPRTAGPVFGRENNSNQVAADWLRSSIEAKVTSDVKIVNWHRIFSHHSTAT